MSRDECVNSHPGNLFVAHVKPIVEQDSDGSDSEIFRVKRRSSLKVEKRTSNDAMGSKNFEHQVSWRFISVVLSQYYVFAVCL